MPLPDVLARLEAMVVAATAPSSEAEAEAAEARVCIICEEAPREVRFACGHALVCNALPARRRRAVQEVPDLRPALRRAAGGGARHARARGAHLRAAQVASAPGRWRRFSARARQWEARVGGVHGLGEGRVRSETVVNR